jgi:hypothetical protein
MLVIGGFCIAYFAIWSAVSWSGLSATKEEGKPSNNAGSLALLSALALDMGQRNPRLENTWVTIAFFGGNSGQGADGFIDKIASSKENSVETHLIQCREVGRREHVALLVPWDAEEDLLSERRLVKAFSAAAATGAGHQPPEMVLMDAPPSEELGEKGFPSLILTSTEPGALPNPGGTDGNDRTRLLPILYMIKAALSELDSEQVNRPFPER